MAKKKIGELQITPVLTDTRTGAKIHKKTNEQINKPIWVTTFTSDQDTLAYIYVKLIPTKKIDNIKEEILEKLNQNTDTSPWKTKLKEIKKEYGGGHKQVFYLTKTTEKAQQFKETQLETDAVIHKTHDYIKEAENGETGVQTHALNHHVKTTVKEGNQIEQVTQKQVINQL